MTLIIAEAGVNHNGDLGLAKRLAEIAKEAGADVVKYQTAVPELVMSRRAPKARYQAENTGAAESQLEMSRKLHLPLAAYGELMEYCERTVGIRFLSTPFDDPSIDLLRQLGMTTWKVPSGEVTNKPYLERIGGFGQEVILSTGMSELWEVVRAVDTLIAAGTQRDQITVLHCSSDYPAKMSDLNLRAMHTLAEATGCRIGYSDHSRGIEVSIAAVALGAVVIEKHFTLDHGLSGPDHLASLEPDELRALVAAIRNVERALGDGVKTARGAEIPNQRIGRRSVHALRTIEGGSLITRADLIMKRPSDGISPFDVDRIIGKRARRRIDEDECIEPTDVDV
ncbi:MAG: N-acetylneuraminate synthase [Deltaproteobacteria bacterium]|nr:N-acetylneuraminate synthase [Deltaproteobacteria bacterium]